MQGDLPGSDDPRAFRRLHGEFGPLVLGVVRSFARDPDHEADLVQEVWLTVHRSRKDYRGDGSLRVWLYRVATRVCLQERRAWKRESARRQRLRALGGEGVSAAPESADALTKLVDDERKAQVHRALARLSARELEVVTLRVLEERQARDVAAIMGVEMSTVRSILRHAVERIRRHLGRHDHELP